MPDQPVSIPSQYFRLAGWLVCPPENCIREAGKQVDMEHRVMKLLCFLADNAGRVVPRDELLKAIWPDVVVQEDSLTKAISELRRLLDDDTKEPRIIRTIRKGGYQLIADVDWQATPAKSPGPKHKIFGWAGIGVAFCAVGGWLAWISLSSEFPVERDMVSQTPKKIARLTSLEGQELDPSLSKDGNQLMYVRNHGDISFDIFVKSLSAGQVVQLTQSEHKDRYPRWSPDHEQVAFTRQQQHQASVMIMSALGGEPRVVATFAELGQGLAWSGDARELFFSAREARTRPFRLYAVELDSLKLRSLTEPPEGYEGDRAVRLHPDDGRIGFLRHQRQGLMAFMTLDEKGRAIRHFSQQGANLSFSWYGDGVFFDSLTSGQYGVQFWDAGTGEMSPVSALGNWTLYPDVQAELGKMVYMQIQTKRDLVERSLTQEGALELPFVASTQLDFDGYYSHSGDRVAYISSASGDMQLYVASADGKMVTQMTNFDNALLASPQWSPDDNALVVQVNQLGSNKIVHIDTRSRAQRGLIDDEYINVKPTWSPDGQQVFFSSNRSGGWQIWQKDLGSGEMKQVTTHGGRVSRAISGRRLLYTKLDHPGLWLFDIAAQKASLIVPGLSVADADNWSVSGSDVYFVLREQKQGILHKMSLTSRDVTRLFPLSDLAEESLDINIHNETVLYTRSAPLMSDILMAQW